MDEQIFNFINKQHFELSVRLNDGKELHIANVKNCIVDQYEAIQRVRELHYEEDGLCGWCLDLDESNGKWYRPKYPCHTIKALNGEQ